MRYNQHCLLSKASWSFKFARSQHMSTIEGKRIQNSWISFQFDKFLENGYILIIFTFQGNYTINNWIIDETFFPSVLPKGENYIMVTTLVGGKPVNGARLYTNIKTIWSILLWIKSNVVVFRTIQCYLKQLFFFFFYLINVTIKYGWTCMCEREVFESTKRFQFSFNSLIFPLH